MARIRRHTGELTDRAHRALAGLDGLTVYGPPVSAERAPLVSFTIDGLSPFTVAEELDRQRIEARAGCHCATLAHHALGLDPPASCRLSFYLYNSVEEVDRAVDNVARIAARRPVQR
jgi:cysteine desulfurase/selenocysteine lyase